MNDELKEIRLANFDNLWPKNMNKALIQQIADRVDYMCERIDADGSGEIDYSEWVIAAVDKAAMMSEENLSMIFQMFDKDGGGSISLEELETIILAG